MLLLSGYAAFGTHEPHDPKYSGLVLLSPKDLTEINLNRMARGRPCLSPTGIREHVRTLALFKAMTCKEDWMLSLFHTEVRYGTQPEPIITTWQNAPVWKLVRA